MAPRSSGIEPVRPPGAGRSRARTPGGEQRGEVGEVHRSVAVEVGGLLGYRRLRRGIRWPLLRLHGFLANSPVETRHEPLDPDVGPGEPPLLRGWSTEAQPPIASEQSDGAVQYEIDDGPLGNRGLVTSVFGVLTRRFASFWCTEQDRTGMHLVHWSTPVEHGLSDLIVHRDLPMPMPPRLVVSGRMTPRGSEPVGGRDRERLPLAEPVVSLGAGPPQLATPLVPGYPGMIELAVERLGHDPRDFAAWRILAPHPPVPSMGMLQFDLGSRPV